MNEVNPQESYVRSDTILLIVTAVVVVIAMIGLHYIDQRTGLIENLIAIPSPATVQLATPSTTP
jgi:hypothetical protein